MKKIILTLIAIFVTGFMFTTKAQNNCNTTINYQINGDMITVVSNTNIDTMVYTDYTIDSIQWEVYYPDQTALDTTIADGTDYLTFNTMGQTGYFSVYSIVYIIAYANGGIQDTLICDGNVGFDFPNDSTFCNLGASYFINYPTQGQQNGSIELNVWGGSGDYGYEWSTGAQTSTLDNIGIGNYSVTITDLNNQNCQVVLYDIYVDEIDTSYNNNFVDSFSTTIDTCLPTFDVDTFYLDNVNFNYDTTEFSITWTFEVNGNLYTFSQTYPFDTTGYYWLSLGFNCDNFNKAVTSYGRTVYIDPTTAGNNSVALVTRSMIYPNPVGNYGTIELVATQNAKVNISIYSVNGKLIKTINTNIIAGVNTIKINTNNLEKGVYFINIDNKGKTLWRSKFVK